MTAPYWTVSHGVAVAATLKCRECRRPIAPGERIAARDGRKVRLVYHEACFSGDADPRTQSNSSFHEGRLPKVSEHAPLTKGRGKWTVRSYGLSGFAAAPRPSRRDDLEPATEDEPKEAPKAEGGGSGGGRSSTGDGGGSGSSSGSGSNP